MIYILASWLSSFKIWLKFSWDVLQFFLKRNIDNQLISITQHMTAFQKFRCLEIFLCQWDSNPRPLAQNASALRNELSGLHLSLKAPKLIPRIVKKMARNVLPSRHKVNEESLTFTQPSSGDSTLTSSMLLDCSRSSSLTTFLAVSQVGNAGGRSEPRFLLRDRVKKSSCPPGRGLFNTSCDLIFCFGILPIARLKILSTQSAAYQSNYQSS